MKPRRLTVHHTRPVSRARRLGNHALLPAMPVLHLQGRWLDRAGFRIGAPVHVKVCAGLLVLEVIDEKENSHAERD